MMPPGGFEHVFGSTEVYGPDQILFVLFGVHDGRIVDDHVDPPARLGHGGRIRDVDAPVVDTVDGTSWSDVDHDDSIASIQ
jgi:hypothetical protein